MTDEEFYTEQKKKVAARKEKAQRLYDSLSRDELKKHFKSYGCCNGFSDEEREACNLAWELHDIDMAKHPEDHNVTRSEPYPCYHLTSCTCGMSSSCDTSD